MDARTGQTFAVDKRSGNSYPVNCSGVEGEGGGTSRRRRTLQLRNTDTGVGSRSADQQGVGEAEDSHDAMPEWIRDALGVSDLRIFFC